MSVTNGHPGQSTGRMNGSVGGKAGQHSKFYDQVDNSTTRESADVDNGKHSGSLPDARFPHSKAPDHQK